MTPFEHLAVLISIVIGLAIAQLLTSVHALAQARARVHLYWLPLFWVALLFMSQVEWWWSIFELRREITWNFFYFFFILLSPVALFLAAAFALPHFEEGESYDLRAHYYDSRRWFFGSIALNPLLDGIRRAAELGSWRPVGAWSNGVAFLLLVCLVFTRRPWAHALVTVLVAALFLLFLVDSALQLR